MLRRSAIDEAIDLAGAFDARGIFLNASQGTPLATLNDTIFLRQNDFKDSVDAQRTDRGYAPDVNYLVGITSNWGGQNRGEEILHTNTLDALKTPIANAVRSHLSFARNVVKPLVIELATEVKKDIEAIEIDPYKNIKIVSYDLPKPVTDPSFQKSLEKLKSTEALTNLTYIALNERAGGAVMDLLLTGKSSFDDEIRNWAAIKGEAFFDMVWKAVFTDTASDANFTTLSFGPDGLDVCLAVYLIAGSLQDNPHEDCGMSLGQYNSTLFEFKAAAAARLVLAIDEYTSFTKTGLMIKNYSNKTITVIGETYRKWIEDGGNNAFILASTLLDKPILYLSDIEQSKTNLQRRWESYVSMLENTEQNNRYVRYKTILKGRTLEVVLNNLKLCYSNIREDQTVDTNIPEFIQFKDQLDEFIAKIDNRLFDNIWELALHVIADGVFFYTDAGKILRGINKAGEFNDSLDVGGAALISAIAYITDFVCDQIVISGK